MISGKGTAARRGALHRLASIGLGLCHVAEPVPFFYHRLDYTGRFSRPSGLRAALRDCSLVPRQPVAQAHQGFLSVKPGQEAPLLATVWASRGDADWHTTFGKCPITTLAIRYFRWYAALPRCTSSFRAIRGAQKGESKVILSAEAYSFDGREEPRRPWSGRGMTHTRKLRRLD